MIRKKTEQWLSQPQKHAPPKWAIRGLVAAESTTSDGWPIWSLRAGEQRSEQVVVGLHGGAYVMEVQGVNWLAYADIVRRTGATVIVPIYPLAPRGTAEVVVPRTADFLTDVIEEYGAAAVGVIGDSAGGGLVLAAVQELVRRGAELPARLVLLSPWLDVALSDPASKSIRDPFLNFDGLVECGRMWAGSLDVRDPIASPLFGSMDHLPPTTVYAGSLDVLYPDSVRLAAKAEHAGKQFDFVLRDGLIHVWAGLPLLPEARAERADLVRALLGEGPWEKSGRRSGDRPWMHRVARRVGIYDAAFPTHRAGLWVSAASS